LIFLFVFGSLSNGNKDVSFNVALINQSETTFAKQFAKQATDSKVLKVDKEIATLDEAKEKMGRSEIDATIVLPADFGALKQGTPYPSGEAKVVYTQNNQQSATALTSILDAQFKAMNAKFVNVVAPFTVKGEQINERSLSSFDYTF